MGQLMDHTFTYIKRYLRKKKIKMATALYVKKHIHLC